MKPVFQTTTGPGGDCFRACVASMLGLSLKDVVHFNMLFGEQWLAFARTFVGRHNHDLLVVQWTPFLKDWLASSVNTYSIVSGHNAAGRLHAVVYKGDELVHDPAPEPQPFVGEPVDVMFFVTRDPEGTR